MIQTAKGKRRIFIDILCVRSVDCHCQCHRTNENDASRATNVTTTTTTTTTQNTTTRGLTKQKFLIEHNNKVNCNSK